MRKLSGFFGILTLFIYMSASAMACELAPVRPVISVNWLEAPAAFDTSRSTGELGRMVLDTVSPYPSHYHADVSGVMSASMAADHNITFHKESLGEQICVSLREINVTITIRPTIYIASDFQDQACRFRQIFSHEAKHIEIDKAVIKKHTGRFTDGLNMVLSEIEDYSSGWIDVSAADTAQNEMQEAVEDALETLFKNMMSERRKKQQELDSRQEYTRISRACQGPSS